MKLKGFTLAELFITLGIIGLVAEMTIPALIKSTQDAVLKTTWKKEYSVFSQATMMAISDNGGSLYGVCTNNNACLRDLYFNYLNYSKKCEDAQSFGVCWHAEGSTKLLNGTPIPNAGWDWYNCAGGILNNGALILINGGDCSPICGMISVDINGFKGPNVIGKDLFMITIYENKLVPFGAPGYYGDSWAWSNCTYAGFSCGAKYLSE